MFKTLNNLTRKADRYGDVHFISFLGSVLSRLAYLNDNQFLTKYCQIMGPVIQPKILEAINKVDSNNLPALLDDQTIFGLNKDPNDIFANYEYQYNGKNFIDFIGVNMPQNVNIINGDLNGEKVFPVLGQETPPDAVKYISIGWSNYGEIYVVADKRMPNTIFLIFRGTYSAKTAAIYTKPTSIGALSVCNDSKGNPERFLYGIFKVTSEMIHTIIESIRYLATDFLGATTPNSVKIFTTGHSLGGAMCTNFAYLWMGIKKTAPYNTAPYNVLADNLICISLGAPRGMGKNVARKFCNFVMEKKILFLRITTKGDPVASVPKSFEYEHPCSHDTKISMEVYEDCSPTLTMRPTPDVKYSWNLDCLNNKPRPYVLNPLSHTIYLDILYTKAVDIPKFLKGFAFQQEVSRGPGKSTICRLIMGESNNYKAVFFDVNKAREKPSNIDAVEEEKLSKIDPNAAAQLAETDANGPVTSTDPNITGGGWFTKTPSTTPTTTPSTTPTTTPTTTPSTTPTTTPTTTITTTPTSASKYMMKIGGEVDEDRRMTMEAFNKLVEQMTPLQGDLCPQKPQNGEITNPFTNQMMPDLSCPGSTHGGKTRRRTRKNKNKNKNKKQKTKKRYTRKY